jgi:hypothetical protein
VAYFYGKLTMPSKEDFSELDTQVRLGLDIAMKMLPMKAVF